MSKADVLFVNMCRDIIENGYSSEGQQVRPRWEDGTPAHTIKRFGIVNNEAGADAESIADMAIMTAQEKQRIFLLMHDTESSTETAEAIRSIVKHYSEKSYVFGALTNDVRPITFD